MTTDEIVKALRNFARKHVSWIWPEDILQQARDASASADLIESLQTQLADYHHMSELVDGKMEENQRLRRINENLTARAEKAEADRDTYRAALEILHIPVDPLKGE